MLVNYEMILNSNFQALHNHLMKTCMIVRRDNVLENAMREMSCYNFDPFGYGASFVSKFKHVYRKYYSKAHIYRLM